MKTFEQVDSRVAPLVDEQGALRWSRRDYPEGGKSQQSATAGKNDQPFLGGTRGDPDEAMAPVLHQRDVHPYNDIALQLVCVCLHIVQNYVLTLGIN